MNFPKICAFSLIDLLIVKDFYNSDIKYYFIY